MTTLNVFGNTTLSTTLSTADTLVANTTGGGTSAKTALIGTATGFGELGGEAITGAWPASAGPITSLTPTGLGWLFDSTLLQGQTLLAGTWAISSHYKVSVGTATVTFYMRAWKYNSSTLTYTLIGTSSKVGVTVTTTSTLVTMDTGLSFSSMSFGANEFLYVEIRPNITANSTGSGTATMTNAASNLAAKGTVGNTEFDTPGYSPTPVLSTSPGSLSFSAVAGGASPASQNDTLSETAGTATAWTSAISYGSGSGWLGISPASGSLAASGNQVVAYTCTTGSLTPGTYTATVTYTASTGGATATVSVTFVVAPKPVLATSPTSLSFSAAVGGASPASQNDTLSETAGTATAWTSAISYGSGSGWLAISPTSGSLIASGNQVVAFTCTTGALAAGSYTATVTYTATTGGNTATVSVTFVVSATITPVLARAPTSLSFTATVGGASPASQNDTLSETAGAATAWTSSIAYVSGAGWLAISPTSGSLSASGNATIAFTCTIGALTAGSYSANVTFTATTGGSTAVVAVTFVVNAAAPALSTSPSSLSFSATVGGANPASQNDTLTNTGGTSSAWTSAISYGSGSGWLAISPASGTLGASANVAISFTCATGSLIAGTYTATVTFTASTGGATATVTITFVMNASGGTPSSYASTILADSPVAYYRMNESSGVIAHDSTANHYDATLTGSFTLSQTGAIVGDTDTSILFNSASAALNLPYTLDYTTFAAFSLEFCINVASAWHYVVVTCNGPTTITYYDGSVITPGTTASIEISSIFSYAGSYLNGYLDEVAIYNYVLTSTQVLTHYHASNISPLKPYPRVILADTPLGYYRLDEASGLVANDSANGNNGTISSTGVSYNLPGALLPALGDTDTALLFDGATGDIVLPSALSTNGLSGLTWELWLNLSNIAFTSLPTVIGSDTPSVNNKGASFYFNSHASTLNFVVGNGTAYAFATVTSAFAPSTWYHLVATYDGFFMVVYVNGVSKATNSIAGPIGTTTNLTTIAHNPGTSGDFLPATYDEVAIYNYALTPAQVLAHYQANILSLLTTASAIYVNRNPIDVKPAYIASTSTSVGVYIQAGSIFEFIFPVYSSYTTNMLVNGSIVLLTFPLPDGPVITTQAILTTQVIHNVLLVQATTLNTTIVASPRVLTPFF